MWMMVTLYFKEKGQISIKEKENYYNYNEPYISETQMIFNVHLRIH